MVEIFEKVIWGPIDGLSAHWTPSGFCKLGQSKREVNFLR